MFPKIVTVRGYYVKLNLYSRSRFYNYLITQHNNKYHNIISFGNMLASYNSNIAAKQGRTRAEDRNRTPPAQPWLHDDQKAPATQRPTVKVKQFPNDNQLQPVTADCIPSDEAPRSEGRYNHKVSLFEKLKP